MADRKLNPLTAEDLLQYAKECFTRATAIEKRVNSKDNPDALMPREKASLLNVAIKYKDTGSKLFVTAHKHIEEAGIEDALDSIVVKPDNVTESLIARAV